MTGSTVTHPDWAIRGAICLIATEADPEKLVRVATSIAVKDGKISAIGAQAHEKAAQVIDGNGLHVLPGVIDSQVHFREPGLMHKEDLETGTRGAALGGVTTVFEMPNTKPSTTTREQFEAKIQASKNRVWTDISFFIGAAPENIEQLAELEKLPGCCAVKVFMGSSTGSLLIEEDENVRRILKNIQRRSAYHCEDEARLRERKSIVTSSPGDVRLHPVWRDEESALRATRRLIRIAEETRKPVHVLHVTTAEEMAFLRDKKQFATVETTPQHLTLVAPECYERLGTLAQMNPPIREARHREALWKAVNDGTVTVLGSDHAPHTLEEKKLPYPDSPSGMTGVQTILPIMLNHVHEGRLSLERLVELLCRNPARLYKAIGKGEIREGFDADFTIVDLKKKKTISNSWIASRSGWTPFDGLEVTGWPTMTVVRGQFVMREDQLPGTPIGRPIRFQI